MFNISDKDDLWRSSRRIIREMSSSLHAHFNRFRIEASEHVPNGVTMTSSSKKVKTLSVSVATSWSTSIIESLRREAGVTPRTNLCTAAKQASSSLTCDRICWIDSGASDTLDLILERTEPTCPAAESRPTTAAVILNGSILIDSWCVLIPCSGLHFSRPQDSREHRWF